MYINQKSVISTLNGVLWWLMDFVLYSLPFGLVRQRTFRLAHGLVRCKHERRCSRACGADVSFRDVTIETPGRKCDRWMWMTSCTGSVRGGFGGCEKKLESWVLASEKDGWPSELIEALRRVPRVMGSRWKSQHRKIVPLSSSCRKTF